MKFVKANPDLIEMAQTMIAANPMESFVAVTVILMSVCYKFRHAL